MGCKRRRAPARRVAGGRRHGTAEKPRGGPIRARLLALGGGITALLWFLLRTGTKPSRITYPCQQAALGTTVAALGLPAVTAVLAVREKLVSWVRSAIGKGVLGAVATTALALFAYASLKPEPSVTILTPPGDYSPEVFLVNDARGVAPGRFGGVDDLVTLMGSYGLKWHRSATTSLTAGPGGWIAADAVVLIKINAQWPQRGGTNTDVLRGVIRRIVEHPDGFVGEVIVADNGQGAGRMDRNENNAEDLSQSVVDVVGEFTTEGWHVSALLWDDWRQTAVAEYADGDLSSGYVLSPTVDPETGIRVSYPKFQSAFGTYVSYKYGIWSPGSATYDADRFVVINMPVLKTHFIYAITASVKNHMGLVTRDMGTDSHNSVGRGGLGSVLAEVRRPDLNILDCIWILARPGEGPSASYSRASRRNQLVASTDPFALDAWATKYIMIPQIVENGYTDADYHNTQDVDNPDSVFRRYLDRSMNELLLAGIEATNDYTAVDLHVWTGTAIPTVGSWGMGALAACVLAAGILIIGRRGARAAASPRMRSSSAVAGREEASGPVGPTLAGR